MLLKISIKSMQYKFMNPKIPKFCFVKRAHRRTFLETLCIVAYLFAELKSCHNILQKIYVYGPNKISTSKNPSEEK